MLLFALLALWLISPIATLSHVEVFSARLESQAISDARGTLALDDQAYPVITGYMYTSKLGVVHALEAIMRVTGPGDISFRLLMWFSTAVFIGSGVVFARRWGGVPAWASLVFVILTPGLVEVSFFMADNLPSAAVACLALALIARGASWVRWLLVGALFAVATLMRLDALLITPSILLLSWLAQDGLPEAGRLKRLAGGWLAAAGGAGAVFLTSWRLWHVSLWQSLAIGRWFAGFHIGRVTPLLADVLVIFGFFGLPSLLVLAAGVRSSARTRSRTWNLCLNAYPVVLYLLVMNKAIELRDFMLLGAPFLVLLGGSGVVSLPGLYREATPAVRFSLQAVAVTFLLLFIAPPLVIMRDGPRTFTGRLWSPILWRSWQRGVEEGLERCDSVIAAVAPGKPILIITTMFNADGYLHLRLLQQGFRVDPNAGLGVGGVLVERYVKGDRVVLQVRTEDPYQLISAKPDALPPDYVADFQLASGLSAVRPADYDRAFLLTWGGASVVQHYLAWTPQFQRPAGPMEIVLPASPAFPAWHRGVDGMIRAIPLSHEDVAELGGFATDQVQAAEAQRDGAWQPLRSTDNLRRKVQSRYWQP